MATPRGSNNISGTQGPSQIGRKPANQSAEGHRTQQLIPELPVQAGRKKAIPAWPQASQQIFASPGVAARQAQSSKNAQTTDKDASLDQSPTRLVITIPPSPKKKRGTPKVVQSEVAGSGKDAGKEHQQKVVRRSNRNFKG